MTEVVFTKEAMQARMAALNEIIAGIEASSPRLERDANYTSLTVSEQADYDARIKAHEVDLFDLKQELAFLARALGGRTLTQGG